MYELRNTADMHLATKIADSFVERFNDVEKTYNQLLNKTKHYPDGKIYKGDWLLIPLKTTYKKDGVTHRLLSFDTCINDLLNQDMVVSAAFSIFKPGVEITPHKGHKGFAEKIYTAHICIYEAKNSALIVGNKKYEWKRGQRFLFDDTVEHTAYNRGKDTRVVLLMDIARDPNDIPVFSKNMIEAYL
jgi:hypothetical protein